MAISLVDGPKTLKIVRQIETRFGKPILKLDADDTGLSFLGVPPPDFGRSVNPMSTKGGRSCPPNDTGAPGFSDLPTALIWAAATLKELVQCQNKKF